VKTERSAPTIGDIAKVGLPKLGPTNRAEAAGKPGGDSKSVPKKGLSGAFAAFFGKALAGEKAGTGEPAPGKQIRFGPKTPRMAPNRAQVGANGAEQTPKLARLAEKGTTSNPAEAKPMPKRAAPLKKPPGPEGSGGDAGKEGVKVSAGKNRKDPVKKEGRKPDTLLVGPPPQPIAVSAAIPKPASKTGKGAPDSPTARGVDDAQGARTEDAGLAARLKVLDLRKASSKGQAKPEEGKVAGGPVQEKHGPRSPDEAKADRDILVDLTKQGSAALSDKGDAPRSAPANGKNFAAVLADRLRDSGNTEIVQTARIVLKDGDSGTIRMRLNPPELGHVKIELHLADNSISGRIVVQSDAARNAFEKGLAGLHDAFRAGGFESARLEVQVGSGDVSGQGAWNGGARGGEGPPAPFWSERSRSAAFDSSSTGMASRVSRAGKTVDIVV